MKNYHNGILNQYMNATCQMQPFRKNLMFNPMNVFLLWLDLI